MNGIMKQAMINSIRHSDAGAPDNRDSIIEPAASPRRKISECIAMLSETSTATIDDTFAEDIDAVIASHRESLDPPTSD
jgi:hypothetical protein